MRSTFSSQKGASAVEFALVLPLLMLILFGIIEFSLLMYNKAMITNASREGARRGIVYRVNVATNPASYAPLTDTEIRTEVTNYLANHLITFYGPTSHTTTITPAPPRTTGALLTVTATYPYQFLAVPPIAALVGSGGPALPGTITLSSATQMRME
jgi:Flp pilus assembly protein TadG